MIFTVDPHPEPAWFSFSGWVFVSMASQGPPISHPCPDAQPSVLQLQSLPKAQRMKGYLGLRGLQTVTAPPGTCFSLTALRINNGFQGNLLTFVSCVFNIGIRVLVTAFQNVLVQNTFSQVT